MTDTATNVTNLRPSADQVQIARAKFIHGLLKNERWSISQASVQMGMNKSVLASRMKGETAFLAVEIEAIAELLKRDATALFGEYIATGPESTEPNHMKSD